MRIIKCDYCGAEIENGGEKNVIPEDNGWTTVSGRKLNTRWTKDCCPRCLPKEISTNREK